ncbi:50S ribosome-binding GTPase [Acidimicrobiia bacterium EGI L10123]|uniref:GTPase n=1 Tax=Salinilacustrithrix flava TaxID=2957203 RepID=UPI003D7C34C4|nr:50S ribosome-binding GTPase [Acidimicrobiia bacterium EGI L10123]
MSRRDERRSTRADRELRQRLDHLTAVSELAAAGPGRLPADLADDVAATVERAQTRLGRGADRTVVALAGATGSGKSSLFNALVGDDISPVGVRRPTTSTARAAVFDADGALGDGTADLLEWLQVPQRHVVPAERAPDLHGLVLLDLPDHDSVEADHRAEVDRLVEVVDAFVWVVDPQKYADAALHEQYLRRFAGHAAVTIVVLNQVDLVPEHGRQGIVDDLARLLEADGLHRVRVVATSTMTGEGVDALRRELAARTAERRALVARLDADVDWLADQLAGRVSDRAPEPVGRGTRRDLTRAFADASGADAVADAVGAAHRRRAAQAVGWPPTRWLGRLRPDPLRRLGLDRPPPEPGTTTVGRTSRAAPSTVADAALGRALRDFVDDTAAGLPPAWQERVGEVANARRGDVADALDRQIGSARLPTEPAGWWRAVSGLQWLLAGIMAVGLVWLVVIGVVAWFGLPDLPAPEIGEVPWPSAMAIGGALAGLLVSVLARAIAGIGARRRTAAARRMLTDAVSSTADDLVADPVDAELAALAELRSSVRELR